MYWAIFPNATLSEDDIEKVRKLYRCKTNTETVRRTTLRPPQNDWPDICKTNFDSALMFRGELMVFKNEVSIENRREHEFIISFFSAFHKI